MTQNFKPIFSYIFQHADSSQIDSWSKRKLFCAPRRARAWAKSVLASPAQGHSSQIWLCHRGYPSLTQNFKPMFSYVFQHADPTQIDSWSKRKLFCAPRRARAWAESVLASPAQGHSRQIWVCHRGYPTLTQNFKPMFSYVFQHADSSQIDSWSKRKLFCAPRRARAWAKSVLASPAQGYSSQIGVCHRGYLSLTQNFKPMFSYVFEHADSSKIDSFAKTEPSLRAAPRARLGKISSGQPSPGPFPPNLGVSPRVPHFDPEFQTHLFLRFSTCRFLPNRFLVKTKTFLRAAPRARLGRISSGQPSPGPFPPNLGVSPRVPHFDPEFQTHVFLRFSACRFLPNRFLVKTKTFLRAAPRARLGKISSGQPSPGLFQPNRGMSPGVPQFDPEFQTHVFLRFSACRFLPNRFLVKTETFLRAAPRARLGKISSGQPSPGPFPPNLGVSPRVPHFDPEFQTHLSLSFSACRFLPNRFLVKTKTFLRAAPRARLGKISSGQPSPGPFQPNLGMSPGVPQFDPEFRTHVFLRFSACRSHPNRFLVKTETFLRAAPRARLDKISSGQPSPGSFQPNLGVSPRVPHFDPEFHTHVFLRFSACRFHPNQFLVKTETFLRAAPRARLGKISSGQPSPGPFQPNLGMSPGVPQFDPEFRTHVFLLFSACRSHPNQFLVKTETFLRAAPRARLDKISSGQPSPGPFQPNLGVSPRVPHFDPEFQTHVFLHFSACRFHPNRFPVKTETFLRAAPRARLGKISSGQPSPGPFQTNLGMSPGLPQYDPEFQTHVFLRFSACRFLPNRFLVKTETFLRAAPRARLGKISSGQPSPGPFQPNLGMSPGVPQFDPEFQTHLFLRFSACRSHPNRFLVKTETFLRAAPCARLGKISSGQPSPGPFQPNLGTSPGVPHFDPEFHTHLFLRFSACRFHPNRFLVKTKIFLRAAPRVRLGKISSGQPSPGPFQPNLGMSPGVPQFDPEFRTHVFLLFPACRSHPNRFLVKTETFLRAAPRARLDKISSGQPSPGPFQPNLGVSPRVPHFDPEFQTHLFLHFSACRFHPNRFPVKTETFLRAAPRARLGKISSGQPSPGPFQTNLGMSPELPQYDPEFQTHLFLRFSACRSHPNRFLVKTETFLRAAPRARLSKISSGQPSPGPFQPNLGMSPGVPQFDPEFQTHVFLRFSACRSHPNRFLVKTETFLRAAPRARLGKISSGQPSPGPFQPNLGMSPGVPHFDPEFHTHLFLRFSACRFHPNRFPVKTETFLRAAPRARLGKISSGQPRPGPFQPNLGVSPRVPHFDPEFQTHLFLHFSACNSGSY